MEPERDLEKCDIKKLEQIYEDQKNLYLAFLDLVDDNSFDAALSAILKAVKGD